MRNNSVGVVVCLAVVSGSLLVACGDAPVDEYRPESDLIAAETHKGDVCAPGNAALASKDPNAPCAKKSEIHVRDLGNAKDTGPSGAGPTAPGSNTSSIGMKTLHPLDLAGTTSCNGHTGPGFDTCGTDGNENCCRATTVPAGTADAATTVATSFDLGVYEVTSGRFAAFVDTFDGNIRGAATGGQLPGFAAAHAALLPASRDQIDNDLGPGCVARSDVSNYGALTWPSQDTQDLVSSHITDNDDTAKDIREDATPARLHAKPINCVTYYLAEAFCAWDGGRLPSNTEWAYAALGGAERRVYPWGSDHTDNRLVTDMDPNGDNHFTFPEDFPYFDNYFNAYHIAPPGRKPDGMAKWGQHDMAGNVLEWTADITGPNLGIVRGGSWEGHDDHNAVVYSNYALDRSYGSLGFRCAYGAAQPVVAAPAVPAGPTLVAVHRAYNAAAVDHLLTLTPGEGAPGWASEGIAFHAFQNAPADARPLYRCRYPNGHFVSNDAACEGYTVESLLGYGTGTNADGASVLVYRCLGPTGDHLTTAHPEECTAAGFTIEGSQAFVHP